MGWGDATESDQGDAANPGVLSDIFARVGGPDVVDVQVDKIVRIHSGNIIGDNLWLWRADHSAVRPGEVLPSDQLTEYHLIRLGECQCDTGLEVTGSDVTVYGLQVEHTVKDLVEWSGERGKVFGFQSELPYDVTQESFCDPGYSGYKVAQGVQEHAAYGIGVYSYFRDHQCLVPSAILAPDLPGVTFTNTFTKQLNGYGGILSILNGRGPATGPGMARWRPDTTTY